MKQNRKQFFAFAAGVLLSIYVASYGFFRANHQIVHRSSVAGDCYSGHSVEGGDAWFLGASFNATIAAAYTPMRYVELGYWHVRQPVDRPLSAAERNRRSP